VLGREKANATSAVTVNTRPSQSRMETVASAPTAMTSTACATYSLGSVSR
jgi:hypothetical protein